MICPKTLDDMISGHLFSQVCNFLRVFRADPFLCRYLRLPELRREIQEGLNVVENWNSANDFILIGKGNEIAANRREDQEVTMLALHLLQNAMVYINTLMIQRVLSEKVWMGRMTAEDFESHAPDLWSH